jgi:hypothetical protein
LAEDVALNCDAITVGADVFLRDLSGSNLTGQLAQRQVFGKIGAESDQSGLCVFEIAGNLELTGATGPDKELYCARDAREWGPGLYGRI